MQSLPAILLTMSELVAAEVLTSARCANILSPASVDLEAVTRASIREALKP